MPIVNGPENFGAHFVIAPDGAVSLAGGPHLPLAGGTLTGSLTLSAGSITVQNGQVQSLGALGAFGWADRTTPAQTWAWYADAGSANLANQAGTKVSVNQAGQMTVGGDLTAAGALTMAGSLSIASASEARISMDCATGPRYIVTNKAGVPRWILILGNSTAESGANAGCNFELVRYDDTGAYLGTPLLISRATGVATFNTGLITGAGSTITLGSDGNFTILFAPDQHGNILVGKASNPTNYYSNDSHVFRSASDINYVVMGSAGSIFNNPITINSTGSSGQIRFTPNTDSSGYGSFFRNDNSNTYLMLTNNNDALGTWNDLRPFTVNNSSGIVSVATNLIVGAPTGGGSTGAGTINAVGVYANNVLLTSDARLKRDVEPLPANCLALVDAIAPKRFSWAAPDPMPCRGGPVDDESEPKQMTLEELAPPGHFDRRNWGFVAQDVKAAMDAAHLDFGGVVEDSEGNQSLSPSDLTAVLWKAVQELSARVVALEAVTP